jgi:diadenosine tetraphosphatase ApaH/serine/threonine PP2A family protein phosphatase
MQSTASGEGDLVALLAEIEEGTVIAEETVVQVLLRIMEVLYDEPNILVLQSPLVVCGDIHGQLDDLLELFATSGDKARQAYLFMGDYVDRGHHSLNTFLYLVCLKLQYGGRFHLLRGNHESRQVSQMYGFHNECVMNYGHAGIWTMCADAFDLLPLAALIDRQLFAVHGGLSPQIPLAEMVEETPRQDELSSLGPLTDLCWSDPDENVKSWRQNQRGAGYLFGQGEVAKFNHANRLRLIVRSHQLAMEGFKWYFPDQKNDPPDGRLLIVWSAPNYAYRSGNDATVMKFAYPGAPEFDLRVFKPNERRIEPLDVTRAAGYFA